MAGIAWSVPASAQPVKPVQHIRVYRVADQLDQDLIVVPPRGRVIFQFQGGVRGIALITQAPDGTSGTQGANVVTSGRGPDRTLDVRRELGRTTEHQIRIQCCMDRQGQTCERWQDAVATPEDLGQRSAAPRDAHSGPSAPDDIQPDPPTGSETGGPKMKVRE